MVDGRRFPRIKLALKVELTLENNGVLFARTKDISEGGIFLELDRDQMPEVGDIVCAQVKDLPGQSETPIVKMEVVRMAEDGVGLKIIDV